MPEQYRNDFAVNCPLKTLGLGQLIISLGRISGPRKLSSCVNCFVFCVKLPSTKRELITWYLQDYIFSKEPCQLLNLQHGYQIVVYKVDCNLHSGAPKKGTYKRVWYFIGLQVLTSQIVRESGVQRRWLVFPGLVHFWSWLTRVMLETLACRLYSQNGGIDQSRDTKWRDWPIRRHKMEGFFSQEIGL